MKIQLEEVKQIIGEELSKDDVSFQLTDVNNDFCELEVVVSSGITKLLIPRSELFTAGVVMMNNTTCDACEETLQ